MKLIFTLIAALALTSCSTSPGGPDVSGLLIVYTGNGVEVSNASVDSIPELAHVTPNGVGYDMKTKKAYIVYLDGHRAGFKIKGAGIGSNQVVLVLEDGTHISVNFKTWVIQ